MLDLNESGWNAMANMLASNNPSLKTLLMENCQGMSESVAVALATALESNTSLERLELQAFSSYFPRFLSNGVGQLSFLKLLESGQNITLEFLYTQAEGKVAHSLDYYLKLNRSGLRSWVLAQEEENESVEIGYS